MGLEFERAARAAVQAIQANPQRYPRRKDGTQRLVMERFPFVIHYVDLPDTIWILAFAHTSRNLVTGGGDSDLSRDSGKFYILLTILPFGPDKTLTLARERSPMKFTTLLPLLPVALATLTVSALAEPSPLSPGVTRVPVTFSGGYDTEGVDHGRPVILIASALGVAPEVFREVFSHVHPAGPNSGGPSDAEARANKTVLINGLGKYGIDDARINEVSNYYRYNRSRGEMWRTKPAAANALVKDGAVIGFEITDAGSGYSSTPTISVSNMNIPSAKVELSYGKNFATNGSVASITLGQGKGN